jgi:hypothetical protein
MTSWDKGHVTLHLLFILIRYYELVFEEPMLGVEYFFDVIIIEIHFSILP